MNATGRTTLLGRLQMYSGHRLSNILLRKNKEKEFLPGGLTDFQVQGGPYCNSRDVDPVVTTVFKGLYVVRKRKRGGTWRPGVVSRKKRGTADVET